MAWLVHAFREAAPEALGLEAVAPRQPPGVPLVRCCHLRRGMATRHRHQFRRCPSAATVQIIDGDPLAPTYACDEHRGCFAGVAWPVSG